MVGFDRETVDAECDKHVTDAGFPFDVVIAGADWNGAAEPS